jgi:hypothetical protein
MTSANVAKFCRSKIVCYVPEYEIWPVQFFLDIIMEYAIFENYRYVPDQGEIWDF